MIARSSCEAHRRALVDFIDRGELAPSTGRALAHLDRCGRCTEELEATVRTITALRRLGDEAGRVEPPADAWPRLRDRIERWQPAHRGIVSMASGAAMSAALVAVLMATIPFGGGRPGSSPMAARPDDPNALELQLDRSRPISLSGASTRAAVPSDLAGWAGPDGLGVQPSTSERSIPRRTGSGGPQ